MTSLTESLMWDSNVLLKILKIFAMEGTTCGLILFSFALTTIQFITAGSLVTTQVPTAQPAPTQHSSNVLIPINVFILNSGVMVILNVNMGKMRILMCAIISIKKIR